jgi:hypothetical protein
MSEAEAACEDRALSALILDESDLSLDDGFEGEGRYEDRRGSKREPVVRVVEFSPYPRRLSSERREIGFTANESQGGLCVMAKQGMRVGQPLRMSVREIDGRSRLEAIARVVWCNERAGERVAFGVELVEVMRPV